MGFAYLLCNFVASLMEFYTYFLFFRKILHIPICHSRLRCLICLPLFPSWMVIYYYTYFPCTPFIIAILFLIFAEKWYFKLTWSFIHMLLLNIVSTAIIYLLRITTGVIDEFLYGQISSAVTFILLCTAVLLVSKKIPADKKPFRNLNWRGYCFIAFVALTDFFLASISSLLLVTPLNEHGRHFLIFSIFLIICISVVLLVMYFRLRHYHAVLQAREATNRELLQMEVEHYQNLQKKNHDLRGFRHDYNSHLAAMKSLAEAGKSGELEQYVYQLCKLGEQKKYITTNQLVADAIINHFYENLPEEVQFEIMGKFPDEVFLDDTDLCILLSNLLRNATEAIGRLGDTEHRSLCISLFADDKYATILTENTSLPYPEGDFPTSKPDKANHGFGLENIRQVAEKYNGNFHPKYEDGIFTASVYLRNTAWKPQS